MNISNMRQLKSEEMTKYQRGQHRQRGMASIVITMISMVIISLIVIGFATVSRREQRQSLDQLMSSQAFYAAESGVEDAKSVIKQRIAAGQPIINKDNCTTNNPSGTYPTGNQTIIDAAYGVSYTCLRVDQAPEYLQFDGIEGNDSIVVPINTAQPIASVTVTWKPTTSPAGSPNVCPAATNDSFSPQTGASAWACGYGVMRADLVPTVGALTRAGLASSALNGFFVPTRAAAPGTLAYAGNTAKPNVVAANCGVAAYTQCSATFTNITGNPTSLALRLITMYQPSNITVQAYTAGGAAQKISGVQAMIDSTGRATDVLRRIQVRLPLVQTGGLQPGAALSSNGSICKRFSTGPNYFSIAGDIVDPDPDPDYPMCHAATDGSL